VKYVFIIVDWIAACQAFALIGFFASLAAVVLLFLYVFIEKTHMNIVYILAGVGNCVASMCIQFRYVYLRIVYENKYLTNIFYKTRN